MSRLREGRRDIEYARDGATARTMSRNWHIGWSLLAFGCLTQPNPDWNAAGNETSGGPGGSTASSESLPTTGATSTTSGVVPGESHDATSTTSGETGLASTGGTAGSGSTGDPLVCNQGQECYGDPVTFLVGGDEPRAIWAGDFDGDDEGDVIVTYGKSHDVQLLRGDGLGDLQPDPPVDVGGNAPWGVHVVDLDGDGQPEVVTANAETDTITLLQLDGDLMQVSSHAVGDRPEAVASGHFDDDGMLDFAVALQAVDSVAIQTGEGGLILGGVSEFPFDKSPESVAVADFDDDGIDDVAAACDGGGVVLRLGESGGFKTEPFVLAPGGHFVDVDALDIDLDGAVDFAAITHQDSILYVWWGDGAGGVQDVNPDQILLSIQASSPARLATGDIDGDAKVDFAVARGGTNDVALVRSTGGRGFSQPMSLPTSAAPWDVALAELDDDPFLDIAVTLPGADAIEVFRTQP